jgi:hypothetical protein
MTSASQRSDSRVSRTRPPRASAAREWTRGGGVYTRESRCLVGGTPSAALSRKIPRAKPHGAVDVGAGRGFLEPFKQCPSGAVGQRRDRRRGEVLHEERAAGEGEGDDGFWGEVRHDHGDDLGGGRQGALFLRGQPPTVAREEMVDEGMMGPQKKVFRFRGDTWVGGYLIVCEIRCSGKWCVGENFVSRNPKYTTGTYMPMMQVSVAEVRCT